METTYRAPQNNLNKDSLAVEENAPFNPMIENKFPIANLNAPETHFTFSNTNDSVVHAVKGTKIYLPQNCFQTISGKQITGPVEIKVQEYLSKEDMLNAKLTTMCGDEILQSGGMINLTAIADGQGLVVKDGVKIKVEMPVAKNIGSDYKLFYGDYGDNAKLNWKLATDSSSVSNDIVKKFLVKGKTPQHRFILASFLTPYKNHLNGIMGVVFHVSKSGKVSHLRITESLDSVSDKHMLKFLSHILSWHPRQLENKLIEEDVNVDFSFIGAQISFYDDALTGNFKEHFRFDENLYRDPYTMLKQIPKNCSRWINQTIKGYVPVNVFTVLAGKIGLMNCDRFYSDKRVRKSVKVWLTGIKPNDVRLVFSNLNVMMSGVEGDFKMGKHLIVFQNIPQNEPIEIFVSQIRKDGVYYTSEKFTMEEDEELTIHQEDLQLDKKYSKLYTVKDASGIPKSKLNQN